MKRRRKTRGWLLLLAACLPAIALYACSPSEELRINEAVSDNRSSFVDAALGTPDWIELYNGGSRDIRLQGYILADKADTFDPACVLPDITIEAGGYCVIPAGSKAAGSDGFCLPFGVSRTGETLYLLNTAGKLIDKLVIPALGEDVSYARTDSGAAGYCRQPTPGAANTTAITAEPEADQAMEPSDLAVSISEVQSNGLADAADWIELYNPSDTELTLADCFLTDDETDPRKHRLQTLTIPAGGYAVLENTGIGIAAEGETVLLFDSYAHLIDRVEVPAMPRGLSWALDAQGAYGYCGVPTPGAANAAVIGSAAMAPMGEDVPVRLSEALFNNTFGAIDVYGDHSDWVELYNGGSEPASLAGYYLSDDPAEPMKWAFPDVSIEPGAYRLVFLSGKTTRNGELHAGFSVSERDGGCYLFHAQTMGTDSILWVDGLSENVSQGYAADGTPVYYAYPTPGYQNARAFSTPDAVCAYPANGVYISEVNADAEWVELHNGSDQAAALGGWSLSDSAADPAPYRLEPVTIPAGGYLVLRPEAAFGVASGGEALYLHDENGMLRDAFETGVLLDGQTSGRTPVEPTVGRVFFKEATPGGGNSRSYTLGRASAPAFSEQALYHREAFFLTLSITDPAATIRYTLDGSEPTAASAAYTEPLCIDASTVVRAAAFSEGLEPSAVQSAHYLFEEPHTLPIVCIACPPALWSKILSAKLGAVAGEGAAAISYYEADGTLGTVFPAAIRARGNTSLKYPQKSLSIHLRAKLGQRTVAYPFWGEGSAAAYGTLVLRNGSQDIASARLRDSFANRAVEGMYLDHIQTRPVIVYVNGTYFGIMDFNEGMNQDFLEAHYGVDPDTVQIAGKNNIARHGSIEDYGRVRRFARTADFTDDAVVETFSQWVDIPYVTDYLIAQTFFGNYDIHNQNYWATDDYAIRWRPYLYDVDRCLCEHRTGVNLFRDYFNADGVVYNPMGDRVNMDIYCALRKNAAWRERLIERYAELLSTSLSVERLTALLDEMAAALRPEMPRHIAAWGLPASMADWEAAVVAMREQIALRHAEIQRQIQKEFGLTEAQWNACLARYRAA